MDEFKSRCRRDGLRITPQRVAIFASLCDASNHPTAEEIYVRIHAEFPNISYDTVNRTLIRFARTGIISIAEGYGHARRFDPNPGTHHHFHCLECGMICDIEDDMLDAVDIPEGIASTYTVLAKRVVITGICQDCRKKTTKSKE